MPPAKGSAEVIVGGSTEGGRRVCRRSLLKGLLEDSLQCLAEELLKGLTEPTSVSWHSHVIKHSQCKNKLRFALKHISAGGTKQTEQPSIPY